MVIEDDSWLRGRGFKSCILDGHDIIFILISCKNCIVCLKRQKINEKEAEVGPFFEKKTFFFVLPNFCFGFDEERLKGSFFGRENSMIQQK